MHRISFIHQPRADVDPGRRLRAFLASLLFHALAIGTIVGLGLIYRFDRPPPKSGSAPGAASISLATMVVVSPPPTPPPPKPAIVLPVPVPTVVAITPPHQPETKPPPPAAAVPVLAVQPSKPAPATPAKTQTAAHRAISHTMTATSQNPPKPATAARASSYAPGLDVLPHPPYPTEAQDLGKTGTVVVNVEFDAKGNVTDVEVAQSSGVPILDSETRSFIREHWHSAEYAGQTIRQPVRYSLEN